MIDQLLKRFRLRVYKQRETTGSLHLPYSEHVLDGEIDERVRQRLCSHAVGGAAGGAGVGHGELDHFHEALNLCEHRWRGCGGGAVGSHPVLNDREHRHRLDDGQKLSCKLAVLLAQLHSNTQA